MSIIYIDLKSAYNTINQNLLFQIIKENKILTNNESDFLESLIQHIYFRNNNKKYYFKNGVHQGS